MTPIDGIIECLIVLGGGGFAAWHLFKKGQADAERIDAEWNAAARLLHGNASGARHDNDRRTLRASLDGKVLLIVAERTSGSDGEKTHVKLTSGTLKGLASPFKLHIAKRGLLGKVAQRLKVTEVDTGDRRFHDEIRVTGDPLPLAAALLDRRTREQVRAVAEEIAIDDGEVTIERDEYPETSETLVSMAHYAGVLVERWNRLERAPARLAEGLGLALVDARVAFRGSDTVVARGMRRGQEVAMTVHLADTLETRLSFGEEELSFPGLELEVETVAAALDERLAVAPRTGGYR